jgi:glyoxylate/hydroxypyruvate reductase A
MTQAVVPLLIDSADDASDAAAWLTALRTAAPDEDIRLLSELNTAELALSEFAFVTNPSRTELVRLPNLKAVQSLWAGIDGLIEAAQNLGFEVARLRDPQLSETMAEAALAWVLYLHRRMPEYREQQMAQRWQALPLVHARDCRVGVLGLGTMGRCTAARLRDNNFEVAGWSATERKIDGVDCYSGARGLDKLLARTEILLCLLPLTSLTAGLLNRERLMRLPKGAAFINFARGEIAPISDLLALLETDHLRHAVLDVYEQEPLPAQSALWQHSKLTLLPHIAAPTDRASAAKIVAESLKHYRRYGHLPASVNLSLGY